MPLVPLAPASPSVSGYMHMYITTTLQGGIVNKKIVCGPRARGPRDDAFTAQRTRCVPPTAAYPLTRRHVAAELHIESCEGGDRASLWSDHDA